MNLTSFLKQIDVLTEQYSAAQLITFIHDIGRILPEHHREDFLERLKSAGGNQEKVSDKNKIQETEFNEMYSRIRKNYTARL